MFDTVLALRANSSVGRASALQAEGPGFESLLVHHKNTSSQDEVFLFIRSLSLAQNAGGRKVFRSDSDTGARRIACFPFAYQRSVDK